MIEYPSRIACRPHSRKLRVSGTREKTDHSHPATLFPEPPESSGGYVDSATNGRQSCPTAPGSIQVARFARVDARIRLPRLDVHSGMFTCRRPLGGDGLD